MWCQHFCLRITPHLWLTLPLSFFVSYLISILGLHFLLIYFCLFNSVLSFIISYYFCPFLIYNKHFFPIIRLFFFCSVSFSSLFGPFSLFFLIFFFLMSQFRFSVMCPVFFNLFSPLQPFCYIHFTSSPFHLLWFQSHPSILPLHVFSNNYLNLLSIYFPPPPSFLLSPFCVTICSRLLGPFNYGLISQRSGHTVLPPPPFLVIISGLGRGVHLNEEGVREGTGKSMAVSPQSSTTTTTLTPLSHLGTQPLGQTATGILVILAKPHVDIQVTSWWK